VPLRDDGNDADDVEIGDEMTTVCHPSTTHRYDASEMQYNAAHYRRHTLQ